MKINAVPGLNLNITIQIGEGAAPSQASCETTAPVSDDKTKAGPPRFSQEAIKARIDNLKKANPGPLRKKSSLKELNSDPYPKPITHNKAKDPKGMAEKPRPGYYH